MRRLLATLLLAAPLFAQQYHNGSKAWEVSRLSTIVAGPSETYAVFSGSDATEIVPLKSLIRVGDEVVVSTIWSLQTAFIAGDKAIVTLVTHDSELHQKCFEELFGGALPIAMTTSVTELVTWYVDKDSQLQKVRTVRGTKQSIAAHIKEHKEYLKAMLKEFPKDDAKTLAWELAKAPNAATPSPGK